MISKIINKYEIKLLEKLKNPSTYKMMTNLMIVCLCWGFTAQSTQWGHVERGQFT